MPLADAWLLLGASLVLGGLVAIAIWSRFVHYRKSIAYLELRCALLLDVIRDLKEARRHRVSEREIVDGLVGPETYPDDDTSARGIG